MINWFKILFFKDACGKIEDSEKENITKSISDDWIDIQTEILNEQQIDVVIRTKNKTKAVSFTENYFKTNIAKQKNNSLNSYRKNMGLLSKRRRKRRGEKRQKE